MKNNTKQIYDILIIGAGPAGMTAAIYAQRAEAKIALIERDAPGGKVIKTSEVENYPGFTSILGPDLAYKMFEQTQNLHVPFLSCDVWTIKVNADHQFVLTDRNNQELYAKSVIVATGTVERKLGVPGEDKLYGKGVSYCAVCDGAFFKNQDVVVIGGGNAAVEEALYLTKFVRKIYLVHRRQGFRADQKAVIKLQNHPKVKLVLDSVVEEVYGDEEVNGVLVRNVINNKTQQLKVNGVFPYIGAIPISDFVSDLDVTNEQGYIEVDNRCATNIPGLFAAGDVTNTTLRQIATAVSDGAKAAQFAIEYIDHLEQ